MFLRCVTILCVFCFVFISAAPVTNAATSTATATASASARVISPLQARILQPLRFGRVHPGDDGGVISINPKSNIRQFKGTTYPIRGPRGHRAAFSVKGEKLRAYAIALPSKIYINMKSRTGEPMLVKNFQAYTRNKKEMGTLGTLNRAGKDKFYVGADLILTSSALPGLYTANIDVLVTYQ